MVHLGTRILVLTCTGIRHRDDLGVSAFALEQTAGYFIVNFEPMLPSTHSTVAFS